MFCCSFDDDVRVPKEVSDLLTPAEAKALAARFRKISGSMFMSFDVFRKSLGLFGANPGDCYIGERLFAAFDKDCDGKLGRSEYIASLAVMLRGSEDARLELSFRVFDAKNCGHIQLEEFLKILTSLRSANNTLSGSHIQGDLGLRELFESLSQGQNSLDLARFKAAVRNSNDFLSALGLNAREVERGRAMNSGETPSSPEPQSAVPRIVPPSPAGQAARPRHRAARVILGPRKGLAVHFGHENWNMVLNMMIGMRLAVGRGDMEISRNVTAGDFLVKDKFSILPSLTNFLDSQLSKKIETMRFMDYAPFVFRSLRHADGITAEKFLRSVGPEQLMGNLLLGNISSLAQQSSEGKSGSFFYYTADGQFLLKTISRNEKRRLKAMLPDYFAYLQKEPYSLLLRFYGLHSLREKRKRRSGPPLYFVVMGNVFGDFDISKSYDLKGSWVERWAKPGSSTLKDKDFMKANEKINISSDARSRLLEQLRKDVEFLSSHGLVDYSLLLGISDNSAVSISDEPCTGLSVLPSADCSRVFTLGVIDILTTFDLTKRAERVFKSIFYDSSGISSMAPNEYGQRFLGFMARVFSEDP